MEQMKLFTSVYHWTVSYTIYHSKKGNPRYKEYKDYEIFYYESQAWERFSYLREQQYEQQQQQRYRYYPTKIKDVRLKPVIQEFLY